MTVKERKRLMNELRDQVIEQDKDMIAARVAYAMEVAIRRVTERVVDWPSLAEEARNTADVIRADIRRAIGG